MSVTDRAVVVGGWPYAQFDNNRKDYEATTSPCSSWCPEFAERLRGVTRETRLSAVADLRGFFRKPHGPGWALVGDASSARAAVVHRAVAVGVSVHLGAVDRDNARRRQTRVRAQRQSIDGS